MVRALDTRNERRLGEQRPLKQQLERRPEVGLGADDRVTHGVVAADEGLADEERRERAGEAEEDEEQQQDELEHVVEHPLHHAHERRHVAGDDHEGAQLADPHQQHRHRAHRLEVVVDILRIERGGEPLGSAPPRGEQPLGAREEERDDGARERGEVCLLYTSPSPRDGLLSRMPSSA